MGSNEIDELNAEVTEVIQKAEELDRLKEDSQSEWIRVSRLEDTLSTTPSLSDGERAIAMRGAVRAALKAKDYHLARSFAEKYLTDPQISRELSSQINSILNDYSTH